jgi:hypothetical protein
MSMTRPEAKERSRDDDEDDHGSRTSSREDAGRSGKVTAALFAKEICQEIREPSRSVEIRSDRRDGDGDAFYRLSARANEPSNRSPRFYAELDL